MLGAILDGIAAGDFMIAPWDERGACTYCDFKPICPRGPHAYVERRTTDPRLSAFASSGSGRSNDPARQLIDEHATESGSPPTSAANLCVEAAAGTGKTTVLVAESPSCSPPAPSASTSSS